MFVADCQIKMSIMTNYVQVIIKFDQLWSSMIKHDQVWSSMIKFDQVWSVENRFSNWSSWQLLGRAGSLLEWQPKKQKHSWNKNILVLIIIRTNLLFSKLLLLIFELDCNLFNPPGEFSFMRKASVDLIWVRQRSVLLVSVVILQKYKYKYRIQKRSVLPLRLVILHKYEYKYRI